MKLLLIHAWNANERSYRGKMSGLICYPSLTLAVLYSLVPKGVFDTIDTVDEYSQQVDYDKKFYDVVMISFDTSSALSAYRHCDAFRKRGAYVVGGGYHATALPDEAQKHCNTVIIGPAERALPAFVKDYVNGTPQPRYCDRHICAAAFPMPARDKVTNRHKLRIPAVIANRGCPNACRYCSMRSMWKNDPRPVEKVVQELRSLHSKFVVFYDPNFFCDRGYALRLMKAMKPLKILWASNATADFGKDHELMQAAYESGCRGVLIGLESLNTDSLKHVSKRFHKTDEYKTIVDNIHSHGMAVLGCFVLGFEHDTEADLRKLPDEIDRLGLDLCRFAILTPYPGTKLYEQYEQSGRILTKNWDHYDQKSAVFKPSKICPKRLEAVHRMLWKEAFSWKRILRRTLRSPWRTHPYILILLGANIGFKYLRNDRKPKR